MTEVAEQLTAPAPASPLAGTQAKVPGRTWYMLILLALTQVIALIDRKMPFMLVEPIKRDLGLSDTEIGLVTGAVFTVVYVVASVPVAKLADRFSRKWVIVACLGIWSALTIAGGFVSNVWQLGVTRIGVALGEGGVSPACHSMLSGVFPPQRRALATSILMAGVPIGMLLGLAGGGVLVDLFDWRTALIVVGLPGLVLGVLMALTVREPPRPPAVEGTKVAVWATLKVLAGRPAFRHLVLGGALANSAAASALTFGPAFIMRTHGLSASQTGASYGLLIGVCGLIGALMGGYVTDRTRARDERIGLVFVAGVFVVGGLMQVAAWAAPTYPLFLLFMVLPQVAMMVNVGTVYPAVQALGGAHVRAMSIAIYLFVVNGVGTASGPVMAGALSDLLEPRFGVGSLRIGLMIVAALFIWAAAHTAIAAFQLPGALRAAKAAEEGGPQGSV